MKILFFAPHSEIWIHAFPEAVVAESLQKSGHEIIYVSCNRLFERFCVPMAAHKLMPTASPEEKARICNNCSQNDLLLRSSLDLRGPTLVGMLTEEDRADAERVIDGVNRDNFFELRCDDVPVGRIALYQVILLYKKFETDFNESEWEHYLVELRNTILSLKAMQRLFERYQPDRVVLYNGLYAVNHVAAFFSETQGTPCYFLHAGPSLFKRLQCLTIGRGNSFSYMPKLLQQWRRYEKVPCSPAELERASDHLLELFRGRSIFAYSPKKSIDYLDARQFFGVEPHQKLLVAAMSSNDEYKAGILVGAQKPWPELLFNSQIEWVQALIEFARTQPDLFIVIRVHPREFPNRRDHRKSQHALALEAAFLSLPDNVRVNWPSDGLSIYDLADQTDVFLNAWSTTGKDMPMLGIPVVAYSEILPLYPAASLNYLGESKEAYFTAIESALASGWSIEFARTAFRWAVYEFTRATVDISESYAEVENGKRTLSRKVMDRLGRQIDPDFVKKRDIRKRAAHLKNAAQIEGLLTTAKATVVELDAVPTLDEASVERETEGLKVELRRLADALYPSSEARKASRLYKRLTAMTLADSLSE